MTQRQRSHTAAPLFAEEVWRSRDACLPATGNVKWAPAGQSPYGHEQFEAQAMAGLVRDLMLTLGPAADTMVISSRQRLLAYLRAGDTDNAAMEMEDHLRVLRYMARVARRSSAREIKEHPARSGPVRGRTARLTKASTTCREAS